MASQALRALARLCGLQLDFTDYRGNRRAASPESLVAVLRAMGVEIADESEAAAALAARRAAAAEEIAPPCVVTRPAQARSLRLRWPDSAPAPRATLIAEDGGEATVPVARTRGRWALQLPAMPVGYHQLHLECAAKSASALVLSAPQRMPSPERASWGVFAPLYALPGGGVLGGPTLSDLSRLGDWVASVGGDVVATLPLLASFTAELSESSPYRPVSRRYWNEMYLDLERVSDLDSCIEARELLGSLEFQRGSARLAESTELDYPSLMGHRRRVLARLAWHAWNRPARRAEIEAFCQQRPEVLAYAEFRARTAQDGPWQTWSSSDDAVAERELAYHVYAQWQMQEQLADASARARAHGPGLYLDLPVGVHPDGFDAFHDRDQLCLEVSAGAPPDALFSGGQTWALPVLDPMRSRVHGHAHFRASVRAHLEHAGILRVDHVMGLYRLFWVPSGGSAADGVYVRYPADELFSVLAIEAERAGAIIVGEDLGTVPHAIRTLMDERGARGMFVGQFEFGGTLGSTLHPPKAGTVASFGTHDTATFAGFASGSDLGIQRELGLLDPGEEAAQRSGRRELIDHLDHHFGAGGDLARIHDGLIAEMVESEAWLVLLTLEDLWLETRPQNVPGTGPERPNWLRKLTRSLDSLAADTELAERLRALMGSRGRGN